MSVTLNLVVLLLVGLGVLLALGVVVAAVVIVVLAAGRNRRPPIPSVPGPAPVTPPVSAESAAVELVCLACGAGNPPAAESCQNCGAAL